MARPVRRLALLLLVAALAFVAFVTFRALRLESRQPRVEPVVERRVDGAAAAEALAAAVRLETVSREDAPADPAPFAALAALWRHAFPRLDGELASESIGAGTLRTWSGSDPTLAPILLVAHVDVVPVAAESAATWTRPPFAGAIDGGFVWGRGSLDDKGSAVAILSAIESLLAQGFEPRRTLLVAFGEDEEVGGRRGAAEIAAELERRGIRPMLVLDEGMAILEGIVPGVAAPVAAIGVAEKGWLTVDLEATAAGGHSSMPPPRTAIGALAETLADLSAQPMPARLDGPGAALVDALAPEMGFGLRLAFANRWLFGGRIASRFAAEPSTNAAIRTTCAPTVIDGGVKSNVLPTLAHAVVNCRILPGDSVDGTIGYLERLAAPHGVTVRPRRGDASEPSPVSPDSDATFGRLARTIREVFPEALVAPGLVIAGTDGRHYARISDHVYRFMPFPLAPEDLPRVHGVDERLAVEDLADGVRFYARLIEASTG